MTYKQQKSTVTNKRELSIVGQLLGEDQVTLTQMRHALEGTIGKLGGEVTGSGGGMGGADFEFEYAGSHYECDLVCNGTLEEYQNWLNDVDQPTGPQQWLNGLVACMAKSPDPTIKAQLLKYVEDM
tara:strand:+ start:65 stop:442 length:378 start_codon:yes stop_codon:yes gene_type:complete